MSTRSITPPPSIVTEAATFIGIDYHKRYSVWHAIDAAGSDLEKRCQKKDAWHLVVAATAFSPTFRHHEPAPIP